MASSTQTGLVLSDSFTAHEAQGLPERPERVDTIRQGLRQANLLEQLVMVPVPKSTDETARGETLRWIRENHAPEYIERFQRLCAAGSGFLDDSDTPYCQATFDVTWRATGSVLRAVDQVAKGTLKNAFCAVRPPGHHAEEDYSMGFCYVNHVAVAARYLLGQREGFAQQDGSRLVVDRVLIVDIDLHHGNGAQHSFQSNDKVMFCSFHGHPDHIWPGTGYETERGIGNILNVPFMPGSRAADFHRRFEERFLKAADAFKPQFILVSAGFDMHWGDPLNRADTSGTNYVTLAFDDFGRSAALLVDLAKRHCDSRLVSVLEGGYNLRVLGPSVAAHVAELAR